MPPKTAAIVRWTGRGSVAQLKSSAEAVLHGNGLSGRMWTAGNSVVVEGAEPLRVASVLGHTPGVAWVSAGLTYPSMKLAGRTAGLLARRYLKRGDAFAVVGEGSGGVAGADVSGAATSGILDAVRGTRVSESVKATFRVAFDGRQGVVGIQVAAGPGGCSTGENWARCLVSGGLHSSVVAWCALLLGYRVKLVHVRTDEGSLFAVAKLYTELSHRVGERALSLDVVQGGVKSVAEHLAKAGGEAFGGFRPTSPPVPRALSAVVSSPLYFMPDENFMTLFEQLGVKAAQSEKKWDETEGTGFRVEHYEGWAHDVSAVLDGLR